MIIYATMTISITALSRTLPMFFHNVLLGELVASFASIKLFSSWLSWSSTRSRKMKPNCLRRISWIKFSIHGYGVRSHVVSALTKSDSISREHVIISEFLKKITERWNCLAFTSPTRRHHKSTHKFSARYRLHAATSRISDESVESEEASSWRLAIIFRSTQSPRR